MRFLRLSSLVKISLFLKSIQAYNTTISYPLQNAAQEIATYFVNDTAFLSELFQRNPTIGLCVVQCVTIEFRQGPIYVVNSNFLRPSSMCKSNISTKPSELIFRITV